MTIKTNAEYQKLLQNTKFVDYEVTLADGTKQLRIISEGTPAQIALHLRNTTPSMVSFKEVADEIEREYEPVDYNPRDDINPAGSYYEEGFTNSELY